MAECMKLKHHASKKYDFKRIDCNPKKEKSGFAVRQTWQNFFFKLNILSLKFLHPHGHMVNVAKSFWWSLQNIWQILL